MYADSSASDSCILAFVCYSLNYSRGLIRQNSSRGLPAKRVHRPAQTSPFLMRSPVVLKTKLAGLLKLCTEGEKQANRQSSWKVKPRISEIHHTVALFLTSVLFKIVKWGPECDMKNYADRLEYWLRWMTVSYMLNNYSLKSRWIVAKYLPSRESGEVNIPKATIHRDWKE